MTAGGVKRDVGIVKKLKIYTCQSLALQLCSIPFPTSRCQRHQSAP